MIVSMGRGAAGARGGAVSASLSLILPLRAGRITALILVLVLVLSGEMVRAQTPIPYIPEGVTIDTSDRERGFDPNTKENFYWDRDAHVWRNTKTGKAVGSYPLVGRREIADPTTAIPYIPAGVTIDVSDRERGFDPKTGENFYWDRDGHVWRNAKTGKAVGSYPVVGRREIADAPSTPAGGPTNSASDSTTTPVKTASSALIPAPPGSAQQDLQQPDHAFDSTTGQNLVWDHNRKSWIDAKSGQALGFQGVLAKDGAVIPAPAPSIAKSGAKTQAKQDPNDPERAYNSITGQTLTWDRTLGTWIDDKTKKNVGFQGAIASSAGAGGAPSVAGTNGPGSSGLSFGFGFGVGTGGSQERDRLGTGGRQERGNDNRGGVDIPIIPIVPLQPGLSQSNAPPPVQPSGGRTVERPPTTPPPTQTAVAPPSPQQPPTAVTPPVAPGEAVCGPIVTEKVFATLAKMTRDFNAKPGQKVEACHNLYGVTTSESAWDIVGLDPGTSPGASDDPGHRADPDRSRRAGPPQAAWNPQTGEWRRTADGGKFDAWLTGSSKYCAIPRPDDACAATVQFMGTCQHAQVVNYVMWGRVNKLCGYPLSDARAAVSVRSFWGDDEMKQRQLDMTNIGYAANSADEVRQGFLTTPSQFQKCQLKCPIKLPATPWRYIWEGFN